MLDEHTNRQQEPLEINIFHVVFASLYPTNFNLLFRRDHNGNASTLLFCVNPTAASFIEGIKFRYRIFIYIYILLCKSMQKECYANSVNFLWYWKIIAYLPTYLLTYLPLACQCLSWSRWTASFINTSKVAVFKRLCSLYIHFIRPYRWKCGKVFLSTRKIKFRSIIGSNEIWGENMRF